MLLPSRPGLGSNLSSDATLGKRLNTAGLRSLAFRSRPGCANRRGSGRHPFQRGPQKVLDSVCLWCSPRPPSPEKSSDMPRATEREPGTQTARAKAGSEAPPPSFLGCRHLFG